MGYVKLGYVKLGYVKLGYVKLVMNNHRSHSKGKNHDHILFDMTFAKLRWTFISII